MNQTDLQGETERALRAEILGAVARGWCSPKNAAKVMDADLAEAITAELLPLFNAAVEQAHSQDEKFTYCAYCGHREAVDVDGSVIAQHIRTCEKHPAREWERQAVAGAYAAAAKVKWIEKRASYTSPPTVDIEMSLPARGQEAILALTPADALNKPPSMDDIENCSEAEYKLTADARQASQNGDACSCSTPHAAHTWGGRPARYCGGVQINRPTYVTESELGLHSKMVEMESQHAAAIASAEARARLAEAESAHDNQTGHVAHSAICKNFDDYHCRRIKELEAAARTPDSTPNGAK